MLYGGGIFGLIVFALWLWAIFDVITTDESLCRNLPKMGWLFIVIVLSVVGALAWLLVGRPEHAGFRPGSTVARWDPRLDHRTGVLETDRERLERERREHYERLDAELDRRLEERVREREADLERREEALRRRENDLPPDA